MTHRLNTPVLLSILVGLILVGACSNSLWDELPSPIARFIAEYFPGSGVKSYDIGNDSTYHVRIDNSVSLVFNQTLDWTVVDGNGGTLPEVFVQDQLPPALFRYIQEGEDAGNVFRVSRDSTYYKVTLHDTVLTYEIETGRITYPDGTTRDT